MGFLWTSGLLHYGRFHVREGGVSKVEHVEYANILLSHFFMKN